MKTNITLSIAAMSLVVASVASAQEKAAGSSAPAVAPTRAVEIAFGAGMSRGVGSIESDGLKLKDNAGFGSAAQVAVGYRLNPRIMLGGYGDFAAYSPDSGSFSDKRTWSIAGGVQANYHILPFGQFDPWVGLGTGYRGYWIDRHDGPTTAMHGLDIVRFQAGVSYRVSESFVMGPVFTATVTEFLTKQDVDGAGYRTIDHPGVNTFLSGGFMGRFDFGDVVRVPQAVASR